MTCVDGRLPQTGRLEQVRVPDASPLRVANGADGPLVALGRRVEARAAVAAALDLQLQLDGLEACLEFIERMSYTVCSACESS